MTFHANWNLEAIIFAIVKLACFVCVMSSPALCVAAHLSAFAAHQKRSDIFEEETNCI